ncbi:SusC/RagA family TonB-linked outer membrane protein [Sphingobacterium gobiense]|uniref:SusC/RagA family TonB-linked outer membrane protein n=1 Tax=Sphingobacterium gobiense TaxID=1382456 RepID=A0A2S9JMF3_9SPHI|nr:SusC/RagA family TonB-linked outer membrane protein [Sphingobacterium gobiense]PRD54179.1 SusC/RagA family TonB-linked outer membrane protein [Sphingobacterium gobiense]
MHIIRFFMPLVFLACFCTPSRAQNGTVTGKVTDSETGTSLVGVSVSVIGTNHQTYTDGNGQFTMKLEESGQALRFSYVGYEALDVDVQQRSQVDVALVKDVGQLDAVVVVGYGTSRVRDLTGSVARVGEDDFNRGVMTSPDQLIQGKAAGVDIVNNSGSPGGGVTFRIRGNSSVRSGNQPLFVIDGVPIDGRSTKPGAFTASLGDAEASNPLNFINPNDIASIDVLKDASATAIYGSRGANGVVIITTKKGKSGAPSLIVDAQTGVSSIFRVPEMMDASSFRNALANRQLSQYDGGANVDAMKSVTRVAKTNIVNMSVGGGNEKGNYRLSAGYHDQEGIIQNSGLRKYTGNYTSSYKFLPEDRLTLDVNLMASNTAESGAPIAETSNVYGSLVSNALEWNPTVPLQNAEGNYVQRQYESVPGLPTNPLALINYYSDKANVTNILGSMGVTFRIMDGLNYKFGLGINHAKGDRAVDISGDLFLNLVTDLGQTVVSNSQLDSRTLTHTLNYEKEFNRVRLNALVGYEFQDYKNRYTNIEATGFSSFEIKGSNILQNPSRDNIRVSSFKDPTNQLQSYFGRLNMAFSNKYLLTATMRADGSTKFGANNKYGYFPSLAAAWVLSEESLFKAAKGLNHLKLRLGWGRTGNQEFPAGASQERYSFGLQQISLNNVANPDLRWETTETYNIGLDFALFESRLNGSIEYFDKRTHDLLFQLPALQPAPAAQFWTNLPATIRNSGAELTLNYTAIRNENVVWDIGANATVLQNRFSGYAGAPILTGQIHGSGLPGNYSQQLLNNQPLFVFYMPRFEGLDDNGLSRHSETSEIVGDPNPNFLMGLSTSVDYKKLSFSASFNGVFGHQLYNNTANAIVTAANLGLGRNTSPTIGLGNESVANGNVMSTRFLESGNYLRLQNVSVSYNLGSYRDWVENVRLSLTGQNLFVMTKYTGFDPEVNTNKGVNGVPSLGIEYIPYPTARTFMLGLTASF